MIKKVKVGGRDAAYLFEVFVDRPEEMVWRISKRWTGEAIQSKELQKIKIDQNTDQNSQI